jgi:prepilin-type N-terminal cleavage/methylation domain-containing protein
MNRGFTLIETIIGVAIFAIIATSAWFGLVKIFDAVLILRAKTVATNLATEQIEIIRNLPYADVGIENGLPSGVIPYEQNLVRDNKTFLVRTTIRNVDLPFDGTIGGNPNDTSPADNKLVEVEVSCLVCAKNIPPVLFSTRVAPKSLETTGNNGALFISVFDSNGQPVSEAEVYVEYNATTTPLIIEDMTNTDGILQIIDAPPGLEAYEITVSKTGYSSESTYATGDVSNPAPSKPHANVVSGQVTQISFSIDKVSTLNVNSRSITCTPVSNVDFNLESSKLIGVNTPKYDIDHVTNSNGQRVISNLEWDTYNLTLLESGKHLIGTNPSLPLDVFAGTEQTLDLILGDSDPNAVLVTVVDGANQQLLSDAIVKFTQGSFVATATTGSGYLEQTDWSGGQGQNSFTNSTKYLTQDGDIETANPVGELKLNYFAEAYANSGWLESSIFDVGTTTNFLTLSWTPSDQPQFTGENSARFQIATNETLDSTVEDPLTWEFLGPNGSPSTYYTTPGQAIASLHDDDRYLKYKLFLATDNQSVTPNISDVRFSFATDCTPVGQAYVSDLNGSPYNLEISKSGYETISYSGLVFGEPWQTIKVTLNPN